LSPARVLVAGAGVFGLAIAIELARVGLRVTLADPAALGDSASGVAAGMLAPVFESVFDDRPDHFSLLMEARDLWPAFAAGLGVNIERTGAVAVSPDGARVEGWAKRLEALGVVWRMSNADGEGLAPGLIGVAQDEDWRLDARPALGAMSREARRLGVETRRAAVVGFAPERADLSDGGAVRADALVVASGASKSLLGIAPELDALTPIKGHIVTLATETRQRRVVRFEGGYLCPTSDGVMLGATMEIGRDDTAVDDARVGELLALGRRHAPGLDYASATPRVGVRASTEDGLPLVGPAKAEGVWLAVGARRNGWLLAPLVARSITAQIIQRAGRSGSGS
jgi:glycine oxidase